MGKKIEDIYLETDRDDTVVSDSDIVIEVNDLSFRYDKEYVFRNLSFDVRKGEFLGIIGPNGTGKSTLLKLILGQLKPSSGEVRVFEEDPTTTKKLSSIGYVPQVGFSKSSEFPATVEEIVMMNLYKCIGFFRFPLKKHKFMVKKALETVNMYQYKDRMFSELSGGQQQRVIIAKAIVSHPEVLILDEPTTGIDHKSEKLLYELLEWLRKERNITIVMISHDLEKIKKYSDKLVNMYDYEE